MSINEEELFGKIASIKSSLDDKNMNKSLVSKLTKIFLKKLNSSNNSEDFFIYAYFCYLTDQIKDSYVLKNSWNLFLQGWVSAPFLMNVVTNGAHGHRNRIKLLQYLKPFAVKPALWPRVFNEDEGMLLSSHFQPPSFLYREILQLFTVLADEPTPVGKEAKEFLETISDTKDEKPRKRGRKYKNGDHRVPSDQLPLWLGRKGEGKK